MSENGCHTTSEGNAVCIVLASTEEPGCGCSSQPSDKVQLGSAPAQTTVGLWPKIRGGVGVACITSPCCTPLIVPLGLALLAGIPVAVWLTQYISWIYGGLTLVSIISLVLGWRWLGQPVRLTSKIPWRKIRISLILGLACLTSPALTPLIVPRCFEAILLTETSTAVWLTNNAGWVYGGLTVVSLFSLGLGLYWLGQNA
jgi:hypothetical protein